MAVKLNKNPQPEKDRKRKKTRKKGVFNGQKCQI